MKDELAANPSLLAAPSRRRLASRDVARDMTPDSPSFTALVTAEIQAGYGVEDIAVRHGVDLEDVRLEVVCIRAEGTLDRMFKRDAPGG